MGLDVSDCSIGKSFSSCNKLLMITQRKLSVNVPWCYIYQVYFVTLSSLQNAMTCLLSNSAKDLDMFASHVWTLIQVTCLPSQVSAVWVSGSWIYWHPVMKWAIMMWQDDRVPVWQSWLGCQVDLHRCLCDIIFTAGMLLMVWLIILKDVSF